jgi:hypothetical protein
MSLDCKDIAIGGKKGVAMYSKNKWKLFGNIQQEQSFFVNQSMVWFNDYLIACVESAEEIKYDVNNECLMTRFGPSRKRITCLWINYVSRER